MTISSIDRRAASQRRQRGFTLAEVLICAGIAGFVLTGILAAFLFIGKSQTLMSNYVRLEQQARRGLERFGEDTRMASAIVTSGTTWPYQVTLTIPHVNDSDSNTVTWWWERSASSDKYQCLMRKEYSNTGALVSTETIISNISAFEFDRWTAGSTSGVQASGDNSTDQLQIHLTIKLQTNEHGVTSSAVAAATNLVVSARFILRNKV